MPNNDPKGKNPTANISPYVDEKLRVKPVIPDHELIRCIGEGSYGEVWLARNVMGNFRAIKVVYRKTFENDRPFEREFNGIKKFEPVSRSDNCQVDILHIGRNEDYFYYVMDLADDETRGQQIEPDSYSPKTLSSEMNQRGRLPFEECLEIGLALTAALDHLHKNELVHRDVKPSNVIFINGIPKLADIGLVTDTDATMSFVGTEGFLPPEGPGTPQADIYSLGKVLYEITTGKDRKDFPEPPTLLGEFADREDFLELNEIVKRACASEVQKRYPTAAAMRADLFLLKNGKSVKRSNRLKLWRKRAAIGTGILAGICALTFGARVVVDRLRDPVQDQLKKVIQSWESTATTLSKQSAVALASGQREQEEKRLSAYFHNPNGVLAMGTYTPDGKPSVVFWDPPIPLNKRQAPQHFPTKLTTTLDGSLLTVTVPLWQGSQLIGFFFLTARPDAWTSSAAWSQHLYFVTSSARIALRNGWAAEAEALVRNDLAMRRKVWGESHTSVTSEIYNWGTTLNKEGKFHEASEVYLNWLNHARARFPKDKERLLSPLNSVTRALNTEKRYPEAETFAREHLTLQEKLFPDDWQKFNAKSLLGETLLNQNKYKEAESLLVAAWDGLGQYKPKSSSGTNAVTFGGMDVMIRETAQRLTSLYEKTGQVAEAARWKKEWIQAGGAGESEATLATRISMFMTEKNFTEAETAARACLAIREGKYPGEWITYHTKSLLGETLLGQKKYEEAEPLLISSFAELKGMKSEIPLKNRSIIRQAARRLTSLYELAGKKDEAAKWMAEWNSLASVDADPSSQTGNSLSNLITSSNLPRKEAAEPTKIADEALLREALQKARDKVPPDDFIVSIKLVALVNTLLREGKYAEAEPLARECLAVREKLMPDQWLPYSARSLLGGSLLGQKKYVEAEPLLTSAYEGLKHRQESIAQPAQGCLNDTLQRLVQLYQEIGKPEKEAEWKKELTDLEKEQAAEKTSAQKQ